MADVPVTDTLVKLLTNHLRRVPADGDWSTVPLADLGLDSMSAIELVLAIEDAFGVQFPEERLARETFYTLESLRAVVETMVAAK